MNDRKLLILDLDETLVYSSNKPLDYNEDFTAFTYFVYKRPFVDEFLQFCSTHFDVAVWTASGRDYAEIIIYNLFSERNRLKFIWCNDRCTRRYDAELQEEYYIKNLKKVKQLGYNIDSILFVDDSPEKLERNYGNHIFVNPFLGSPDDVELNLLKDYLFSLIDVPDVRSIEKRGWRNK